jgi:hypothetical protein
MDRRASLALLPVSFALLRACYTRAKDVRPVPHEVLLVTPSLFLRRMLIARRGLAFHQTHPQHYTSRPGVHWQRMRSCVGGCCKAVEDSRSDGHSGYSVEEEILTTAAALAAPSAPGSRPYERTFYKRTLPTPPCIDFSSEEGGFRSPAQVFHWSCNP